MQYLGRHSVEAPGLVVLEDWKDRPQATALLKDKLPPGATLHPDLSYDGRRVLFAFADHSRGSDRDLRAYFIYEYSFETGEVRQITGTAADPMVGQRGRQTVLIEDTDPCYLLDGGMAFISTLCEQFGRCYAGGCRPAATVYRAELDGSKMRPLSFSEAQPTPGSHKVVATAARHYGQTLGTIVVVDPRRGQDQGAPLTWVTPELISFCISNAIAA